MSKKKQKKVVKRPSQGKSAVGKVLVSAPPSGGGKKATPPPAIQVGKVDPFLAGTKDATALKQQVRWVGGGTVAYEPDLDTLVLRPATYTICITVNGAPDPQPAPAVLTFKVLALDPKLKVTAPDDLQFKYQDIATISAKIVGLVHHDSTGTVTYDPALSTLDTPGEHTVTIQVPAHGNYKASKPATLTFTILKREPVFTVSAVPPLEYGDQKDSPENKIPKAIHVKAGGPPKYNRPLHQIKDPGLHEVQFYLEETADYAESEVQTINVTITSTAGFKSQVFEEWEQANSALLKSDPSIAKKVGNKKYEIQTTPGAYTKRAEIIDALNAEAGVPDRRRVWLELGYDLKSAEWQMPEHWTSSLGVPFHLTISANSIIVPNNRAGWAASAAALFDSLFMSPPVTLRVHLTLEEATGKSKSSHLFLGGVTGANKAVGDDWWRGQAADMKPHLDAFRNQMIAKIGALKTKFKL